MFGRMVLDYGMKWILHSDQRDPARPFVAFFTMVPKLINAFNFAGYVSFSSVDHGFNFDTVLDAMPKRALDYYSSRCYHRWPGMAQRPSSHEE